MVNKLVNKSEFAEMAGVTPAAITKASKTTLLGAVVGKRINLNSQAAQDYLTAKNNPPEQPGTGIDHLYEKAVEHCKSSGKYTPNSIQQALGIGWARAKKLAALVDAAGVKNVDLKPPPPEDEPKTPHVRGPAAARETKKSGHYEEGSFIVPDYIGDLADRTLRDLIAHFGTDTRFLDWLKATKEIENIHEKRIKNATSEGELVSRKLVKTGIIDPLNSAHIKLLTDGAKTIARRATAMHDSDTPMLEIEKFVADQITSFLRPVKAKVAKALKNV